MYTGSGVEVWVAVGGRVGLGEGVGTGSVASAAIAGTVICTYTATVPARLGVTTAAESTTGSPEGAQAPRKTRITRNAQWVRLTMLFKITMIRAAPKNTAFYVPDWQAVKVYLYSYTFLGANLTRNDPIRTRRIV